MRRRFFFHYNKLMSSKRGVPYLTIHWKNKCIPVRAIKCLVPTETKENKTQPRIVLRGWAESITITNEIAEIL